MGRFGATVTIDRPIEQVFAFLADGENDKQFSTRVMDIRKATDGPVGVGTIYASTVKDAGFKSNREFQLTVFEPNTTIRWTELSKSMVFVPEGGYDMKLLGPASTELTFFNVLEGRGIGKLISPLATSAARRGSDEFANAIKAAVEAS